MRTIQTVEFHTLITPIRQLHVRPGDMYIAKFCDKTLSIYITGVDIPEILVPVNNVKFMTFKKETSLETTPKLQSKTTAKRVSKKTRLKS